MFNFLKRKPKLSKFVAYEMDRDTKKFKYIGQFEEAAPDFYPQACWSKLCSSYRATGRERLQLADLIVLHNTETGQFILVKDRYQGLHGTVFNSLSDVHLIYSNT